MPNGAAEKPDGRTPEFSRAGGDATLWASERAEDEVEEMEC